MKQISILDRLALNIPLVSDGAIGTYLQSHGLEPGGCPEEFNESNSDIVRGMAKNYFDAGSEMVLTNSFGGSRFMLQKYGYADRVREFNRLAASHAVSQKPPGAYVVGSVGPSGEFMEPLGEVTEPEMLEAFGEQMSSLAGGGVDAILIETGIDIKEAAVAIKAAKDNTGLPVMATMTFDKGPRGFFTMMGVTAPEAARKLEDAGADVVGINCGNGIRAMIELASEMREATDAYMIVHSNAGIPSIVKGRIVYSETPEFMAEGFKELVDMGIDIVGGCCGTTPDHIRAIVKAVRT